VAWCVAHGTDPVLPTKAGSPGKPCDALRWHRHVVRNLAPPGTQRGLMRDGDMQSLPRNALALARAGWMTRERHSRRQAAEGTTGALEQVFRGDRMAQKEENAAGESPGRRSSTTRRAGSRAERRGAGHRRPATGIPARQDWPRRKPGRLCPILPKRVRIRA